MGSDEVVLVLLPIGDNLVVLRVLLEDGFVEGYELRRQVIVVVLGVEARVHVRACLRVREISGRF